MQLILIRLEQITIKKNLKSIEKLSTNLNYFNIEIVWRYALKKNGFIRFVKKLTKMGKIYDERNDWTYFIKYKSKICKAILIWITETNENYARKFKPNYENFQKCADKIQLMYNF